MTGARTLTSSPWFAWDFLGEIAAWSLRLAALAAAGGMLMLWGPRFALGCLIGAGSTTAWVRYSAYVAERRGEYEVLPAVLLVVGRLVVVVLSIVAAGLLPAFLDLSGTIVGVVAFDVTLVVVGSYLAIRRGFGQSQGR